MYYRRRIQVGNSASGLFSAIQWVMFNVDAVVLIMLY